MEKKGRKRLRIELEIDGAEGQIELPDRDAPIQISALETYVSAPDLSGDAEARPSLTATARPYNSASADWDYRCGLRRLLEKLDHRNPYFLEVLSLEARLIENERTLRVFGYSEEYRAERSRIVLSANQIALATVGTSYNNLCQFDI